MDAADVRESFVHYVADAQDISAATNAIAIDFGANRERPLENPSFWLALALVQWKNGWIDPLVTRAAFAVIDDKDWPNAFPIRKRQVKQLRSQLESPPRIARPFPKPWPTQLGDFAVGEIIGRPLPSGRLAVGKVIGFRRWLQLKVRGPAIRLQKWVSGDMPNVGQALELEPLRHPIGPNRIQTFMSLVLVGPRAQPFVPSLFLRPGIVVPLRDGEDRCSYHCVSTWGSYGMDELLETAIERWWSDPELPAMAPPPWLKAHTG
jgi:hypothetical protein